MRRLAIVLVLLTAIPAVAADLTGTVVGPDGTPIAAALVTARSDSTVVTARTDENGRFVIAGLEAPVVLRIQADGHRDADVRLDTTGDPITVELVRSGRFTGDVEVTATRAEVGVTPVTVTNVTREDIEANNWGQDVPMFLQHVPGFYAYNDNGHGQGYSYFFLRGFNMQRTAVFLNGVPLNDAHSHAVYFVNLADFLSTTGDIQVQRGVGTSLYGGSAIGGSLDFRTRTPSTEPRLRVSGSGGSWGTRRFLVEYDSGLVDDKWAATFRYSRIDSDGYRDQSWLEAWNYYATVEHYGEKSTTRLVLFGGPERTHLAYAGITEDELEGRVTGDKRRDRRRNPLTYPNEIDEFFQPHYQLINTWQARPDLTVQNTLYYFEGDGFFEQYNAGAFMPSLGLPPVELPDGGVVDTTDVVTRRHVDEWDAGWIPSVEWRHGGGRGSLQAGMALRYHTGRHWGEATWAQVYPPGLPPNNRWYDYELDKTTIQPFVQETWRASDAWVLFGGLTYVSHSYDMHDDRIGGVDVNEDFDYWLPRLGATFLPADGWTVYGNVSRGGREPAFRDIFDPQDYWFGPDPNALNPEELTDYELGATYTWPTGSVKANLYLLDFDNAIVWAGGLDNNGLPITANGATTTHQGAELELTWTPRPRWGGRLSLSTIDATFDDFQQFDFDGNFVDYSGNAVAGVPDVLASLELTGGWGPVDGLVSIRHVGEFFLDNSEDERKNPGLRDDPDYIHRINEAFTTVDLGLKIDLGPAAAGLIGAGQAVVDVRVNNVFDELYTTFGYVWGPEPTWIPAATRSTYVGVTLDW
jgi:iron complex outermembrane receptor protein